MKDPAGGYRGYFRSFTSGSWLCVDLSRHLDYLQLALRYDVSQLATFVLDVVQDTTGTFHSQFPLASLDKTAQLDERPQYEQLQATAPVDQDSMTPTLSILSRGSVR